MSPAAKPQRRGKIKGHIRRNQIVQASLKIIADKGVGNLTTAAIAREVGISEANLYRHFRNKDEIYREAVSVVRSMIVGNLETAIMSTRNPVRVLKKFFSLQISLMKKNSGILRFLFSEELHDQPDMRGKVLDTMYFVTGQLASLLKIGQKNGYVRSDLDAGTTILMFVAMVQGLAFRWSLSGFSFSLESEGMKVWKNFETCISVQ